MMYKLFSGCKSLCMLKSITVQLIDMMLFRFFTHYHPFLPFLQPSKSPNYYYRASRLLFWTIISVASRRYSADLTLLASLSLSVPQLMWSVLQSVPQSHHDVKALCLLCTWPFPINSSSCDPTFMLSGTMMHLAMQIGLHRPSQAQDFSKITMKLQQEDIQDRKLTWIACRIVAQRYAKPLKLRSNTNHGTLNSASRRDMDNLQQV